MLGVSRPITSRQQSLHGNLPNLLRRHQQRAYRRPVTATGQHVFDEIDTCHCLSRAKRLIIDAGCGNGESTLSIARQQPDTLVIGIDKSLHRLRQRGLTETRSVVQQDNAILARMNCVDFWCLAGKAGWQPTLHYLLYPNPWPKPRHVMRRWYAHPVFTTLVALGGTLELRTNWRLYAEEFAIAIAGIREQRVAIEDWHPDSPLSPHERKYHASGQRLYRCRVDLAP